MCHLYRDLAQASKSDQHLPFFAPIHTCSEDLFRHISNGTTGQLIVPFVYLKDRQVNTLQATFYLGKQSLSLVTIAFSNNQCILQRIATWRRNGNLNDTWKTLSTSIKEKNQLEYSKSISQQSLTWNFLRQHAEAFDKPSLRVSIASRHFCSSSCQMTMDLWTASSKS